MTNEKSHEAAVTTINEMCNRSGGVVIKEDKLKNITEKEYFVIAILEIMEDVLWVNGTVMNIGGETKILKGDTDGKSIDHVVDVWKSYFKTTQEDETWKDGKHCGDCTKVPMTCFRCMCESRLEIARKFMNYFNNGEYQTY